jgi:hypothetical protein
MADLNLKEVVRLAISLLDKDDILEAAASLKADTSEKEIAVEYVKGYAHFLKDLAEKDKEKMRQRADYEVRELVGHVNVMLKTKQPEVFMKMVLNSPKHYKLLFAPGPEKKK